LWREGKKKKIACKKLYMSDTDYKKEKKKFILYIIAAFVFGVVMIYTGLKDRFPFKLDDVVIELKLYNARLIGGIVLVIASVLLTVLLIWVDKKTKSLRK
jgi:hypothetical protein